MAEGSVGLVWHKNLGNLLSITFDPRFPSFLVCRKVMKISSLPILSVYSSLYRQSFVQNTTQQCSMIVCMQCLIFILLFPIWRFRD